MAAEIIPFPRAGAKPASAAMNAELAREIADAEASIARLEDRRRIVSSALDWWNGKLADLLADRVPA